MKCISGKIKKQNKDSNDFFYKKDRLNQLRGFCKTYQCNCNASEAARQLGMEAPTISRQIKALERNINIKLFNREIGNKLTITDEGKKFYKKAIIVLHATDSLFQNFRSDLEKEVKTTLKIATFDIIIEKMLKYLLNFKDKHKSINLSLYNVSIERAFEKLINDEIDIAIYPTDENDIYPIEIEREKILKNISYLVLYDTHPLANKKDNEITKEDISLYMGSFSNCGNLYSRSFKKFIEEYELKIPTNIIYEQDTNLNINYEQNISLEKAMIKNKVYITFIDAIWLTEEEKNSFVLKEDKIFPPMYFYCFFKKNTEHKDLVKKFLKVIKQNKKNIFK